MRSEPNLVKAIGLVLTGLLPSSSLVLASAPADSVVLELQEQSRVLLPLAQTLLARRFLNATADLPPPRETTLYFDPKTGHVYTEKETPSLPDSLQGRLQPQTYNGTYYYQTRYGSPLNYLRMIDLLAQVELTSLEGKWVLDFGYGRIAHLRLLASLGANVVGIDVDPILRALYASPGDQGEVPGFEGPAGTLRLIHGFFPSDKQVAAAVGSGYDLILSKNTLKGGHEPAQRKAQSQIINLGVSDSLFVEEIYRRLNAGGFFLMYTLSSPRGNPSCPFPERMLRAAGFEILAYDHDDSPPAMAMLNALRVDRGGAASESTEPVTALYTLLRKPIERR